VKDVPPVKMPMPLADLMHPEHWPFRGRNDHTEGMSPQAVLTPSADEPEQESGEDDDQGLQQAAE
jgi:hypothetical protein